MTPVEWTFLAGQLGYMALEYWLGKTDKVKSHVLEALLYVGGKILRRKKV